jgi:NADP-dependent 3-hydroxy acid dehydrogenase YdfG
MGSSLEGTVALVTGASSDIGAATARHLADNSATVALVARRKDRLDTVVTDIERSGGTAFTAEADIGDRTQADGSVAPAVKQAGRLDILINNAGLMLLARSSAPMSMTETG